MSASNPRGPQTGRHTAEFPPGTVVFLIGMRINSLRRVRQWWPVAMAMPKMLRELFTHREMGMLGARTWLGGRTVLVQQYWRSMDELMTYAQAADREHFPAWKAFNLRSRGTDAVGIWHEAYVVDPETSHIVYVNMPVFGMAEATAHVPATHRKRREADVPTTPDAARA